MRLWSDVLKHLGNHPSGIYLGAWVELLIHSLPSDSWCLRDKRLFLSRQATYQLTYAIKLFAILRDTPFPGFISSEEWLANQQEATRLASAYIKAVWPE